MKRLLFIVIVLLRLNIYAQNVQRPNIILIMSDDMGYSDIGCYGGEIKTPHLDILAENGIRLTQFYNSARCCPTRASLLTGLYPQQTGIGLMTNPPGEKSEDIGIPGYRGQLNNSNVTLAEVLKSAGYHTYMTGKWHLGVESDNHPMERGFDMFYGLTAGASNHFKPEHPRGVWDCKKQIEVTDSFYSSDNFTTEAIKYINGQNNKYPFFLYLAYTAPHWPIQAPQNEVEPYVGKYMGGWEKIRAERFIRMKEMGIIDNDQIISPLALDAWSEIGEEKQKEMDLRMAIYAAMITRMDKNIGRLVNILKKNNQLDNTVIIFINDNGACAEGGNYGWGEKELLGKKEGYWLSYGEGWANASNTPFRFYKHWVHEGGISSPFIIHWPAGIDENKKGTLVHSYAFLPDIMATFLELGEADYPEEIEGHAITTHSGRSILPLLKNDIQIHTEPIFFEHHGNKAVRLGRYKLVCKWSTENENNWELYDIENDRSEINNLAKSNSKLLQELLQQYEIWANEKGVLPYSEVLKIKAEKK